MNRQILNLFRACLGLTLMLEATAAQAETQLVVPTEYASTSGNTADAAPLGADNQHFQQEYAGSLLTLSGLSSGDKITAIGFRVANGDPSLTAQTISDYSVWMGVAAFAPGSMSSTFANNRSSMSLVRSGSLTISSGQFAGGSGVNPFGMIPLDTPYTYTGGDLLIEISYSSFLNGVNVDSVYPYNSSLAEAAFGTGSAATTADIGLFNEAFVMALSVQPVPEASALAIFTCGLVGLFCSLNCRQRR